MISINVTVRQNNDVVPFGDYAVGCLTQCIKRLLQACLTLVSREQNRYCNSLEARTTDMTQLREFFIRQNRRFQSNMAAALRFRIQQVAFRSDRGCG
ncbi:hypothetical protein D3C73_892860 [compost metagenome]